MAKVEVDAQNELKEAFETRDLNRFQHAISLGAQPNQILKDDVKQMTIYEKVLSETGYARFITACIDAGCNVNYINPHLNKAAIHYAAESKTVENLAQLLHQSKGKINVDHQFEQETPLNVLSKSLKNLRGRNLAQVVNCMRLLLNNGASPNIVDREGKTPLQYVLQDTELSKTARITLIIQFLRLPELSLHNYREGLDYLLQHGCLDGRNPMVYNLLVRQLISLEVEHMLKTLEQYKNNIVNFDSNYMLHHILREHMSKKTDKALTLLIAAMMGNTPEYNERLVEAAIKEGSWTTVLSLLKGDFPKEMSKSKLLKIMIRQVETHPIINLNHSNCLEYQDCLMQLLSDQRCINQADGQGNTPLHYAVLYRNEIAIRVLLRQGAKLGVRNWKNALPIQDLDAKLLEEHFDYCITSRGQKPSHEEYEIIINYLNLTKRHNELDIAPIVYMAKSKELCPLLQHPLITCFLELKWQRLSTIFYTHFLILTLFAITLVAHVAFRFPQRSLELPIKIVEFILWGMITYMLVVELLTYLMVNQLPSYLDPPLLALLILTCCEWGESEDTKRIVAVFAIMLMALKYMIILASMPVLSMSTHMRMLQQVTTTFLKSLAHYSIFIITFGLCFFILFGTKKESSSNPFLNYFEPDKTFMKTLLMFNGQYDSDDIIGFPSWLILIMFMFMTMILTNLLSGLAVNDTQSLRDQVELNAAIYRTKLLHNYEGFLNGHWENCDCVRDIFQKMMRIRVDFSYGYLSIYPNKENRAQVYEKVHRNKSIESVADPDNDIVMDSYVPDHEDGASNTNSNNEHAPKIYIEDMAAFEITSNWSEDLSVKKTEINFDLQIDNQTVKQALNIIKQKSEKEIEEKREELMEKRQEDLLNLLNELKSEIALLKKT